MRKVILAILFLCSFARGQNPVGTTLVTATVTDAHGMPYAGGTFRAKLATPAGTLLNAQTGTLDSSGTFSVSLKPDSWIFTICAADNVTCFGSTQTISGTSQSLTSALSALAPPYYTNTFRAAKVGEGGLTFNDGTNQNTAGGGGGGVADPGANGIVKRTALNTTTPAVAGTDYVLPSGNVATSTALAANGANCNVGDAARGVDASGAAENCFTPAGSGTVASGTQGQPAIYTATGTAVGSVKAPVYASTFSGADWGAKVVAAQASAQCSPACTIIVDDSLASTAAYPSFTLNSLTNLEFTGGGNFGVCTITAGVYTKIYNKGSHLIMNSAGTGCTAIYQPNGPALQVNDQTIFDGVMVDCNNQPNSTGILRQTAGSSLRNARVTGCTLYGIDIQGDQFSLYDNIIAEQNRVGIRIHNLVVGGGANSLTLSNVQAASNSVGIFMEESGAFGNAPNYCIDCNILSNSVAGFAMVENAGGAMHFIGGTTEANGGGAATITVDGIVIPQAAIYVSTKASLYISQMYIADASISPWAIINNTSRLILDNVYGYGTNTGTLVSTDSTSSVYLQNRTDLTGTITGVAQYPPVLTGGGYLKLFGEPVVQANSLIPNAYTGNPDTPAFADITGATSQATAVDSQMGTVNTVTYAASAGSAATNHANFGNVSNTAGPATASYILSILFKCSAATSLSFQDTSWGSVSTGVYSCPTGRWQRAAFLIGGNPSGTALNFMVWPNDTAAATVSFSKLEVINTVGSNQYNPLYTQQVLQNGAYNPNGYSLDAGVFCSDAGSTDAYACNLSPTIATYVTGTHYRFKANTANTGASTVNLNSLGAKTVKKVAGGITTDLADNDIRVGQWVDLVYDGTNMQMQSLLGNAASAGASPTFTGLVSGGGFQSLGTKFTASGCSNGTTVGGATAGSLLTGASGACTLTITPGDTLTATNGWSCWASDQTTAAGNPIYQNGGSTTTATLALPAGNVSGDKISFGCIAYATGAVVTRYYGYQCNGTTTNTCTSGTDIINGLNGVTYASAITTGSNAAGYSVKAMAFYSYHPVAGTAIAAVYDNASPGSPVASCTASASVTPTTDAWIENTNFSGCSLAANTTYKLAIQFSDGGENITWQGGVGTRYAVGSTYGTFGSGVTWGSAGNQLTYYVRVTEN